MADRLRSCVSRLRFPLAFGTLSPLNFGSPFLGLINLLSPFRVPDTYLHTVSDSSPRALKNRMLIYDIQQQNLNAENYLLTPSEAGDLCVAKLFPPDRSGGASRSAGSSSQSHGSGGSGNHVRCEASRNLRWTVQQTGIQVSSLRISRAPTIDD